MEGILHHAGKSLLLYLAGANQVLPPDDHSLQARISAFKLSEKQILEQNTPSILSAPDSSAHRAGPGGKEEGVQEEMVVNLPHQGLLLGPAPFQLGWEQQGAGCSCRPGLSSLRMTAEISMLVISHLPAGQDGSCDPASWSSCLTLLSFRVWDLQPLTVLFPNTFSQEQSDHGSSGTGKDEAL